MTVRKFTAYMLRSVSLFAFAAMLSAPAHANPEGGHVVAGDATIAGTAPNEVTIRQTSDKAIIDWNSFSIGADERTVFDQPSSASVTLNRDIGGNPSAIFGRLQSNGRIFLVNRNGILFGENARIDVAGLVASTADIANENFLAGRHEFDIPGTPGASVINLGELSIADHGLAALVAPHVRNDGVIVARLGKVALASGDGFALDLHGDDMISLFVEDGADQQLFGLDGEPIDSLVENNGWIGADGGFVILTAAGARQAVNNVVTHHGVIEARTIGRENGQIVLGGDVEGNVIVTGDIRATGENEGETGGHITVTGERLALLQQATVDASGFAGGGTVLLGGDYMGGNGDPGVIETYNVAVERGPVPTAKRTVLAPDVTVAADALQEGNGGKVIVWADEATVSAARISARGGLLSGDGGFVETSGRYLDVREAADVSAPNGLAGTWLLDPIDIVVEDRPADLNIDSSTDELLFRIARSGREIWGDRFFPTGDPSFIDTDTIEAALDAGTNVLVTTRSSDGDGDGDIHIRDDIVKSDGGFARLSFHAAGDIDVDRGVEFRSSSGRFNIELAAFGGRVTARGLGRVDLLGGALIVNSLTGIDIDSNYDMPNLFVGVNLRTPTPPGDVDVNIDFDNDRVRFSYTDELLTIPTGGIVLTDRQAESFLEIETFHGTSLELEDRAILSIDRKWKISGLADAGAARRDRLNDIPEVIGGGNFYVRARDPRNNAVFPVIEVSDDEGLTVDRLIPTSPTGERLVATRSEIERVEREIREREQESEERRRREQADDDEDQDSEEDDVVETTPDTRNEISSEKESSFSEDLGKFRDGFEEDLIEKTGWSEETVDEFFKRLSIGWAKEESFRQSVRMLIRIAFDPRTQKLLESMGINYTTFTSDFLLRSVSEVTTQIGKDIALDLVIDFARKYIVYDLLGEKYGVSEFWLPVIDVALEESFVVLKAKIAIVTGRKDKLTMEIVGTLGRRIAEFKEIKKTAESIVGIQEKVMADLVVQAGVLAELESRDELSDVEEALKIQTSRNHGARRDIVAGLYGEDDADAVAQVLEDAKEALREEYSGNHDRAEELTREMFAYAKSESSINIFDIPDLSSALLSWGKDAPERAARAAILATRLSKYIPTLTKW